MAQRLTLSEFQKKLLDIDVPDEELRPYFELDTRNSRAFGPQVVPDMEQLAVGTEESTFLLNSFNGLSRWRRQQRYKRKIRNQPGALRIISEGDSWFQYPFLLNDVIDHLMDQDDFAIFSLGAAGDLLGDMLRQDEVVNALTAEQARVLLISGGGNDLLGGGNLTTYVHPFKANRAPKDYLNSKFSPFLARIMDLYRDLFARSTRDFPGLQVFCHGYDHAIPNAGRWLGRPLATLNINDKTLQEQIVHMIVERFNEELSKLADEFGAVTYVDCRSVVQGRWHDELHPTDEGYRDVAVRFQNAITNAL